MIAALQRLPTALPGAVWLAILYLLLLATAVIAPGVLTHNDPLLADPVNAQLPPSAAHWLGTDQLGRDLLTRVIYGSRYSLLISVAAMALAVLFGTLLGLIAALARGVVDELLSRAVDVISAFPDLLLALMLIAFTGPGTNNLIIALGRGLGAAFCPRGASANLHRHDLWLR
jgi:ABC-type dipeptide/oligopeptide/nickel transport systems, permease components